MRHIHLVMCDPTNADQAASLQKVVDAHLAKFPDAKLVWLQSAATKQIWNKEQLSYVMHANHLLTCAIEFEGTIGAKFVTPRGEPNLKLKVPVKPGAQALRNPRTTE